MLADTFRALVERTRRLLPIALAVALFALLAAALASTYFGDSRSPYGMCYGTNGRAVPCAWIEQRR